jgi:hypothetical protein
MQDPSAAELVEGNAPSQALLILDSGRLEGIETGEFDDRMPVFSG